MRNRFSLIVLFLFFGLFAGAQRGYFLYFQTENQRPFYLRMGEKIHNSTASGYLILPKLKDTTHFFSIGFPGEEGLQNFYYTMNHKDHGFLIKYFEGDGWALFDLQTLGIQKPTRVGIQPGDAFIRTEKKQPDEFTDLLVKASQDTTLREKIILEEPVPVSKDPEEDTINMVMNLVDTSSMGSMDTLVATKIDTLAAIPVDTLVSVLVDTLPSKTVPMTEIVPQDTVQNQGERMVIVEEKKEKQEDPIAEEKPYQRSQIVRRSESSTTGGFGIVFLDKFPEGHTDTIRILITPPVNNPLVKPVIPESKPELKFLEIIPDSAKKVEPCPVRASEEDFFNLRKEMAGEIREEAMVDRARKAFAGKCFTAEQARNLGNLFLNEEKKLDFFQSVIDRLSDPNNAAGWEAEFRREETRQKFRDWWQGRTMKSSGQ